MTFWVWFCFLRRLLPSVEPKEEIEHTTIKTWAEIKRWPFNQRSHPGIINNVFLIHYPPNAVFPGDISVQSIQDSDYKMLHPSRESVTEGQDPTTALRTMFGVTNGKCPLKSANGLQETTTQCSIQKENCLRYMYKIKCTLCDFHLNWIGKKPGKQHLFLGQRTPSSPWQEVCV